MPIQILSEIGKGGYGTVYECVNENGLIVAVKKIPFDKYGIRCLNEATIMSSFNHPNIASAYNIHTDDQALYIFSKKAKCDLNKWTRKSKKGKIPDQYLLFKWASAIVSALACFHSQGVIHCDMKASNILMFNKTDIRLNDFTLSIMRHKPGKKYTYNTCTSTHRPLEVWQGTGWDEKIDIWGLGCTLFEIAYGELLFPYQGGNGISDEEIKQKTMDCLLDWGLNGLAKGQTYGSPKGKFTKFSLPEEFHLPQNKLFNQMILSMLHLNPKERPTIFEIKNHTYFKSHGNENGLKKIPFLVYSTESTGRYPSDKFKSLLQEYVEEDVIDLMCEIYSRTFQYNCYDIQNPQSLITDQVRTAICTNIACKLLKHALPLNVYKFNASQLKDLIVYETRFCDYLTFRLHVSPDFIDNTSFGSVDS
jgi:serine/threonine protein kinase